MPRNLPEPTGHIATNRRRLAAKPAECPWSILPQVVVSLSWLPWSNLLQSCGNLTFRIVDPFGGLTSMASCHLSNAAGEIVGCRNVTSSKDSGGQRMSAEHLAILRAGRPHFRAV